MAMLLNQSQDILHLRNVLAGRVALADTFKRAWKRRQCYRQIVNELEPYSDRQLQDIGVLRSEIRELAAETAAKV